MVMINKKEATVASIVLIATAYFTIFYNIFQDGLEPFLKDYPKFTLHAITGLLAMGFGLFVLWFFSKDDQIKGLKRSWWKCSKLDGEERY